MKKLAKEYKINLIPGSFVEKAPEIRCKTPPYLSIVMVKIIGKYRKIHLFDAASYKESAYVTRK